MEVFTASHVFFNKMKSITKRSFILVNRSAVNINDFTRKNLSFYIKKGILVEEMVHRFDIFSTHTNFIKTINGVRTLTFQESVFFLLP